MKAKKVPTPLRLQNPYLVQRCKTLDFDPEFRTGEYLKLDYMGSAEFEFGAIPRFQREVNEKLSSLHIHTLEHNGTVIHFASTKDQAEIYGNMIRELIDGKTRTKESVGFTRKEVLYVGKKQTPMFDQPHAPFTTDVWLDLTNSLFFARTEAAVKNLFITIPNAVRYMDAQKGK